MGTINVGRENSAPIDIYYEDQGSGPAVVLTSGWPFDGRSWEPQVHPLLAAGYRVITYDRRGFGRSSRPATGYDFDTLAADLGTLLRELDLGDVTVVGFSLGTGEVARYIGRYGTDRLRSAVLIESLAPSFVKSADNPNGVDEAGVAGVQQAILDDRYAWLTGMMNEFLNLDEYLGKRVSEDTVRAMWAAGAEAGPEATWACPLGWLDDFTADIARIDVPTLILHGTADRILSVDEEWVTVPAAVGDVRVRIVRPRDAAPVLPVVVYMHGGGWILGNAGTHDRLVRELAVGARAAVAFVEYTPSPEARYPVAIEQGYATAQWLTREGSGRGLDAGRMAVAGESVGGNMTAALALMAKERGDVTFVQASMYYPVTDAAMDTASYDQFATGYYLSRAGMEWFWDAYAPDHAQRSEITASPNQATVDQVRGLPPTYLCVDEADVLRDEGEAYAAKLRAAGVPVTTVRYEGTVHDFMLLNSLSDTHATRAAIAQATAFLRAALGTD